MIFNKLFKLIRLIFAELLWQKSLSLAAKNEHEKSLKYLRKSYSIGVRSYNDYALEMYLLLSLKKFKNCMELYYAGAKSIESSKAINKDEKKYFRLYIVDVFNLSVIHGNLNVDLIHRDKIFNFENIDKRHLLNFPVM
jgi:hypothetical protein